MLKLGKFEFKNKTELKEKCKTILYKYPKNSELKGNDLLLLKEVLSLHENYELKTKGLSYTIYVRPCPINPKNNQFYVVREDGSDTDFSYVKAITSNTTKSSRIKKILRDSINLQTIIYKDKYFKENAVNGYVICAETGLKIKKKESHLDHYPTQFDEIVKMWVDANSVKSEDIDIYYLGDNTTCWKMENQELLQKFIKLHEEVATYRVVLNKVNLQRSKSAKFEF
jgi:hypothetical protein